MSRCRLHARSYPRGTYHPDDDADGSAPPPPPAAGGIPGVPGGGPPWRIDETMCGPHSWHPRQTHCPPRPHRQQMESACGGWKVNGNDTTGGDTRLRRGERERVKKDLVKAGGALKKQLVAQKLKLSPKSKLVASELQLGREIQQWLQLEGVEVELAEDARDLGVGVTSGRRRTVRLLTTRLEKGGRRRVRRPPGGSRLSRPSSGSCYSGGGRIS